MKVRFAFAGFRHVHVVALLQAIAGRDDCVTVACAEENNAAREAAAKVHGVKFTHESIDAMLNGVDCDIVVIGETYGRRGALAAKALGAGKHILSDKPICTRFAELESIEKLSRDKKRSIGCQFDLRDRGNMRTMRRLIGQGAIGDVCTINFMAQHPLLKGSRPEWYFEPGQHGGTINDIIIHAIDLLPWLTGHDIAKTLAARCWGGERIGAPHFDLCAQTLFTIANGAGVFGDASYLAPDGCGYAASQYWRFTIHGSKGIMETSHNTPTVQLTTHADKTPQTIESEANVNSGYLDDFLAELRGETRASGLTTKSVLMTSRKALEMQKVADDFKASR